MSQQTVVIDIVSDGKPGHLNQSLGLAEALQRHRPGVELHQRDVLPRATALAGLLRPTLSSGADLLIAAGHATHLTLLAMRRAAACPAIVLMRPSLPLRCFDLCIHPRHDGGRESADVWLSDGPLNRMLPASTRSEHGLILIGGPSPHFVWDADALLPQLQRVCDGSRDWFLTTSRRTPDSFLSALQAQSLPRLTVYAASELPNGWLRAELPRASACWVTPDSASMVYESLTAGCAVGLFDLAAQPKSRVASAVVDLQTRGLLKAFADFDRGESLAPPADPFAEADRCAQRILERGWLS